MESPSTSPLMAFSATPSWSRSNTPVIPVLESVSEVELLSDGFQLGAPALDVIVAARNHPASLLAELVTRNTFLEFPEHHSNSHFVDEIGRRKRAVSEGTGLELMQTKHLLLASNADSLGSVNLNQCRRGWAIRALRF